MIILMKTTKRARKSRRTTVMTVLKGNARAERANSECVVNALSKHFLTKRRNSSRT